MNDLSTPEPVLEIAVGTVILIIVIFVHGAGIRAINLRFNRAWVHVDSGTSHWRINLLLAATIASLSALHFTETLIWAAPIYARGFIPSMRDSYYFVLESYTTLGQGNITLPERWRLLGPIIAISGLFTFGWTSSVLVSIMTEFGKLDRARIKRPKERASDQTDPDA